MNKLYTDFSDTIKTYVKDVCMDVLGNIIAHKPGKGERVMLIAHYDVVCLMITHIDENGFLFFKPAGGIDASILPARKVLIKHGEKSVTGIIGKKPVHLIREDNNGKVNSNNLWIDIGAKNKEDALNMVSKGDYVYFPAYFEELPNKLITGAYLDNHIGLLVLRRLAERLNIKGAPCDVYFVASNHEEIGMRGAIVATQAIKPDVCICVDVTHATDYPSMNIINDGDIKLGEGCVLAKGPNIYPQLFSKLEATAISNDIIYQVEVSPYPTGTDANLIQISGNGVKTAVVLIPCRYMHTPHEICSIDDIESSVDIIYNLLQKK